MVIDLSRVQFRLKSYAWFQNRTSAQREFDLKSRAWFQTKIARHEVQLPLYYIHFEISQIQDLVSSNIFIDAVLSQFEIKFIHFFLGGGGVRVFFCLSLFLVRWVTMKRPCSIRHWFVQKCKYKIQSVKVPWKSPQKSNETLQTTRKWGQTIIQNQLLMNDTPYWGLNVGVLTDSIRYLDKYQTSHI